jgi:glycosyltransferase involved in cell wall biosynthesis
MKTLLFVGPQPPPIGGSPLTVQAMLEELALYPSVRVKLINTSPGLDVRKKMTGFNFEKVWRSGIILPKYLYQIPGCDAVVVFANDLFAITLAPVLLLAARLFRKPFYLKPVGAGLDLYINRKSKILREYLLAVLRTADGILAQTQLLKEDLSKLGCPNAYYLPGCRPLAAIAPIQRDESSDLRLIFLGHITRLKGPLVLLEALKSLSQSCDKKITCDFYGPIHDEIHADFTRALEATANARYCGVAKPGTAPQLISGYDALVLPTYYDTEGHPGVIIEAMHAGVPVISTQVRTFPELITHGSNGFLVPQKDSAALAESIRIMAIDPSLRKKMGELNHLKGIEFRADTVVERMLKIVFPGSSFVRQPV